MTINFDYPDPSRVLGLSTSHWTGIVDWNKARDNGIRFAYIKAQNGINNPVNFWKENYEGAKKAGIKVGGYTWLYPPSIVSPGAQARKFAEFAKQYNCELPWCVDFEWTTPTNPTVSDLWGFVIPFEQTYGSKPAIYTAPGYWKEYGSKNSLWADYPLWQAQYNEGVWEQIPPWTEYKFLQWTETGKGIDYGVPITGERACELNYYYGTLEEFEDEFGALEYVPVEPDVPPTTGEIMTTQKGEATKGTVNIKNHLGATIATMPLKGWLFGDYSTTKSDLIGFLEWYRPTGEKMMLPALPIGKVYKASVTNMTVTPYTIPGSSPSASPSASPETGQTYTLNAELINDETGEVFKGTGVLTEVE